VTKPTREAVIESASSRAPPFVTQNVTSKDRATVSSLRIVDVNVQNGLTGESGRVAQSLADQDIVTSNDTACTVSLAKDRQISVKVVTLSPVTKKRLVLISTVFVQSGRIKDTVILSLKLGCRKIVDKLVENVLNLLILVKMSTMSPVRVGTMKESVIPLQIRSDRSSVSNAKRAASFAESKFYFFLTPTGVGMYKFSF